VISNLLHKAEIFAKKRKSDGKAKKGSGNIELFRSFRQGCPFRRYSIDSG